MAFADYDADARNLERVLHHEIPQTRNMGIRVESWDGETLVMSAPLALNLNHKSTAFGGSLYSLATLAGWGLLYLILKEWGITGQIVIQSSRVEFCRPVSNDFHAVCSRPAGDALTRFRQTLTRKKRARLELTSRIWSALDVTEGDRQASPAMEAVGEYVVLVRQPL